MSEQIIRIKCRSCENIWDFDLKNTSSYTYLALRGKEVLVSIICPACNKNVNVKVDIDKIPNK